MNTVQRVARNSAAPLLAQLINKVVDLGFALVVLHVLSKDSYGEYVFAVIVWTYAKTFSDFGLGILATRDVSRDRALADEYFGLTTLLRLILWAVALPVLGIFTLAYRQFGGLTTPSMIAIALLIVSILPDSYSDAANAIYNALERMHIPAGLTLIKNALKVVIGVSLVLAGWGPVGLALTALLTNVITAWLFLVLLRRIGVRARWTLPGKQARQMLLDAWPLFLNTLLAGLFFRSDVFVLKPSWGDGVVAIYDAAYKFLSLVLLIPQYFTLALFPQLARLAGARDESFAPIYNLALKLLLTLALPICVIATILAPELIGILAGSTYLPDGGTALRILIWLLPFSYVNGLVQYVLIAAGQQRALTPAFAATFAFNLIANLIFTPRYGYPAAAAITIASELVLIVPFLLLVRRRVGPLPSLGIIARPLGATAVMGLAAVAAERGLADLGTGALTPWLVAIMAALVYLACLIASGGIGPTERHLALRLLGRVPS
jgi:O-antigen/teichoic acid export membrane protein